MIRVEISRTDLIDAKTEAEAQFLVRMKLRGAGIPIGPWGTSAVERGILSWRDDYESDATIFEWKD